MSGFHVLYGLLPPQNPTIADHFVAWNTIALSRTATPPRAQLSTGDVAELLGVHASTVKRWFGGGSAPAGRRRVATTAGGHRRVSVDVALRVARERGHEVDLHRFDADASRVWWAVQALRDGRSEPAQDLLIAWLRARRTRRIGRFLRHLTAVEAPVDPAVLDGVFGGFMRRVGAAWASGNMRISDERAATREVAETIYALLDSVNGDEDAAAAAGQADQAGQAGVADRAVRARAAHPTAVVATIESDQHVLGSLLVRLVLAQRGWRVEHLGAGVPIAEIVATQRTFAASLVCVSVTPPLGASDVRRLVEVAARLSDPCRPCSLLIGGGAAQGVRLPSCGHPFSDVRTLSSLVELCRWLEKRRDG